MKRNPGNSSTIFVLIMIFTLFMGSAFAGVDPAASRTAGPGSDNNFIVWIGASLVCAGLLWLMWFLDRDRDEER